MAATVADEAFERLYARYGREVYRYALALLRNPTEAEDVAQTTFLNAFRALRAGERPRQPHNWLIAIAHNACRSRVRFALRRPKEVPLDDVVDLLALPETERPNISELLRTMRQLPSNQRSAITMRELEGRSYVDIAESLGVTVPAAEALIGRARRTLRAQAAAFRSLLLVPLPRSLRKLAENGEAAGGAVGTAAAVKLAALLALGAIGGGVGIAAGSGSRTHLAPIERSTAGVQQQRAQSRDRAALSRSHTLPVRRSERAVPAVEITANGTTTVPAAAADPPAASGGTVATGIGAAGAETTVGSSVAGTVAEVTQAVTTASSKLPAVTTPSATMPPLTTPTVSIPVTTVPPVTVPPLP